MSTQTAKLTQVSTDTITLDINGELTEIQHQLGALQQLLGERQLQTIQHADKIYNIQHIDEANFGFLTGKRAFNEELTSRLLNAMQAHTPAAGRFMAKVNNRPAWERNPKISDKAKEIIIYSFVGPIGIQLSKLFAIGKAPLSEAKQKDYLSKCLHIVEYTLDLLCFALLSRLWDRQTQEPTDLPQPLYQAIQHRLDYDETTEFNLRHQLDLLCALYRYYLNDEPELPLPELQALDERLQARSELYTSIAELQKLADALHQEQYSLLDCHAAEQQLANFLSAFAFLCAYKMASIHEIGYRKVRNSDPRFIHRYTALGIDSKAQKDAEQLRYVPDTSYTDAVMLFKGDHYREGINLFPFVIDYNALSFEHGAMISFFKSKRFEDDNLEFLFLESREVRILEPQGLLGEDTAYEDILMDNEKRKQLNQDVVLASFRQARDTILNDIF